MNANRSLMGLLGAALLAGSLSAQGDLVAKRDKKLESPFLKAASWITDYDVARATAKESGKPIFAYFTRSYSP